MWGCRLWGQHMGAAGGQSPLCHAGEAHGTVHGSARLAFLDLSTLISLGNMQLPILNI